jgi:hypothetical protein
VNSPNVSITCIQEVSDQTVELSVRRDHDAWQWEVRFATGQTLDIGAATTSVAGQTAAQCAFERRLKRAGLLLPNFTGYRWASL